MKGFITRFCVMIMLLNSILIATVASAESSVTEPQTFTDTNGHWGEVAIKTAVEKGYVSGYADGTFKPNAEVTKAEFMKMLVSSLNLEISASEGAWYEPYINAAKSTGFYWDRDIEEGTWNNPITRKEMAMLAVRAGVTGYTAGYTFNQNMYEATKAGILQGVGNHQVAPDGVTTRAAAVVVIERVLDIKVGKTLPVDKYTVGNAEILWHKTNIYTMIPEYFQPNYINTPDININNLKSKTSDGSVIAETTKIVAVDLDDPKDPNWDLVRKYDLRWYTGEKYVKLADSGGIAVISVNEIERKKKMPVNFVFPSGVQVYNSQWSDMSWYTSSVKNPRRSFGFILWDPKFDQYHFSIKAENFIDNKFTYVSGTLLPKGFKSKETFYLHYNPVTYGSGTSLTIMSYTQK